MFYLKIHESYRNVVALCDKEILGKKFEEGIKQLDIRENFYKGQEKTAEEVREVLSTQILEDSTFYISGENSVKLALETGIITENHIGKVNGIPFALILV